MLIIKRRAGEGLTVFDARTNGRVGGVTYLGRAGSKYSRAVFEVRNEPWTPKTLVAETGEQFIFYPESGGNGSVVFLRLRGNEAVLACNDPGRHLTFLRNEIAAKVTHTRKEDSECCQSQTNS